MFSSSLCAPLIALIASAISISAAPSLTLDASTLNGVNVDGLENLKVTTTITNTGDGTLRLLNDPRGVLDTFPEDSFFITDLAGSGPSFNGAKVYHPLDFLAKRIHSCFWSPLLGQVQPRIRRWP